MGLEEPGSANKNEFIIADCRLLSFHQQPLGLGWGVGGIFFPDLFTSILDQYPLQVFSKYNM